MVATPAPTRAIMPYMSVSSTPLELAEATVSTVLASPLLDLFTPSGAVLVASEPVSSVPVSSALDGAEKE